ncbi:PUR family DNA/RNA-binding protein [Verrucomicrobiota bacterium]
MVKNAGRLRLQQEIIGNEDVACHRASSPQTERKIHFQHRKVHISLAASTPPGIPAVSHAKTKRSVDKIRHSAKVAVRGLHFAQAWSILKGHYSLTGSIAVDNELFSEQVQVERKLFSFDLRENPRGRFLRITEDVGGRRDTVIIPATGLEQIREILDRAIAADRDAGPSGTASAD